MEPQSSRRTSLWSQFYKIWKAINQEFTVFYLGGFLNSKCFILFVSRQPFSYLVMEQGGNEDTEDNNREDTEGR